MQYEIKGGSRTAEKGQTICVKQPYVVIIYLWDRLPLLRPPDIIHTIWKELEVTVISIYDTPMFNRHLWAQNERRSNHDECRRAPKIIDSNWPSSISFQFTISILFEPIYQINLNIYWTGLIGYWRRNMSQSTSSGASNVGIKFRHERRLYHNMVLRTLLRRHRLAEASIDV